MGFAPIETIMQCRIAFIFICLSAAFLVCYHLKNILAWWIALLCYFLIYVSRVIVRHQPPDDGEMIAFVFVYIFVFWYLLPKYDSYKEFIEGVLQLKTCRDLEKRNKDLHENNVSISQNPLQLVLYAMAFIGLSALCYLFCGGDVLERTKGTITANSQHITELLLVILFVLFYWKRSVLAWWVALLTGPVPWLTYFIFQPFVISEMAVQLLIYMAVVWYLIKKYKPYCGYIKNQ